MMRLASFLTSPVAPRYALLSGLAALSVAFTGCLFSPSGVNVSDTLYPMPDEDNIITVTYTAPADKLPAEKLTFQVEAPTEDASIADKVIEDTGPEFTATYAADNLDPGIYYVNILYDDDAENIVAKQAFVVPEAEATPEEGGSGEETTEE